VGAAFFPGFWRTVRRVEATPAVAGTFLPAKRLLRLGALSELAVSGASEGPLTALTPVAVAMLLSLRRPTAAVDLVLHPVAAARATATALAALEMVLLAGRFAAVLAPDVADLAADAWAAREADWERRAMAGWVV